MKISLLTLGAVLMGTVAAMAQPAERIAAFLDVVEEAGCVINEANNQAILARLDMTEDEGGAIVLMLMADGRAVPQGDDLRISTGTCQ